MSTSITETLNEMVALTKQNLKILSSLNDAFFTKKSHISTEINGERIAIPSYLSLESKIDTLRQDFDNLVNAPVTGEAFTYFDGSTQKMELSGYPVTPEHVDLHNVSHFSVRSNSDMFKDFMSPNPYVRFDISSIPNNIKHVEVKKICINNNTLREAIMNLTEVTYAEVSKLLYIYEIDKDYTEYNTIKRLPLRSNNAFGNYTIKNIKDNYTDANFDEFYELELNEPLTYFINNGTIERNIKVGDELVTQNTKVKMVIEEMNESSKTIKVRILYGAYADLCDERSNNPSLYKLRYLRSSDLSMNKYVDVPLEEDRYVCIFVAPINDTTNMVAPFGGGLFIDVDTLTYEDENGNLKNFRDYYDAFVNNVGDALFSITKMMDDDDQVERLTQEQFEVYSSYSPVFDNKNLTVVQINKHLNDAESVKNIRKLYEQKTKYKSELDNIQTKIDGLNKKLNDISFDDQSNVRSLYTSQLSELNSQRHEIQQSINNIVQEISQNANQSDIPIENAKYHIRGFVPTEGGGVKKGDVIKIDVEYRYKNKNKFTGNAETIGDEYIFSDWNKMTSIYNHRKPTYEDNIYKYRFEEDNTNKNEISFNQIDIPISQGECVDIRYRYVYRFGFPFVEMSSGWSGITTIDFPEEFLKNVDVLDIISENNDDIKKNQFVNLMEQRGVLEHVQDMIQDQTLKYFHQPSHISSGFYTAERRIIPLDEKLQEFTSLLTDLQTEVYGANVDNLQVSISDNSNSLLLKPNILNTFHNNDYKTNENKVVFDELQDENGNAIGDSMSFAYSQLTLSIYNSGSYNIKLHTMFQGDNTKELDYTDGNTSYPIQHYKTSNLGVYYQLDETIQRNNTETNISGQVYNQWLYFRACDADKTSHLLYDTTSNTGIVSGNNFTADRLPETKLDGTQSVVLPHRSTLTLGSGSDRRFATLFPYVGQMSNIVIPTDQTYVVIKPGETLIVPLSFYYWFNEIETTTAVQGTQGLASNINNRSQSLRKVSRAIEFNIRPSLFREPMTYKVIVEASYADLKAFKTKSSSQFASLATTDLLNKKYNSTIPTVGKISR